MTASANRPYALTSRLHNNDAMLGVKTCRAARTRCAGRALALSASQSVRGPGGMACRGWPAGCMLGDGAHDSASFDPQHAGAPFCDVICIRSITKDKVMCLTIHCCSQLHHRFSYNTLSSFLSCRHCRNISDIAMTISI